MIHNGIIENFQALRDRLEKAGHALASDTDTECIAHLLEEHVRGTCGGRVRATVRELEGAYALVVLSADDPERSWARRCPRRSWWGWARRDDAASDIPAVLARTRTVVPVEEGAGRRAPPDRDSSRTSTANPVGRRRSRSTGTSGRAQKGGFDDFDAQGY